VDGLLSYIQGTSMSAPIACGIVMLMINLYKLINPVYLDEPKYVGLPHITSNLIRNSDNGLLNGGYGKFSYFMEYVKSHWLYKPEDMMSH
jgi:hypothetical protein